MRPWRSQRGLVVVTCPELSALPWALLPSMVGRPFTVALSLTSFAPTGCPGPLRRWWLAGRSSAVFAAVERLGVRPACTSTSGPRAACLGRGRSIVGTWGPEPARRAVAPRRPRRRADPTPASCTSRRTARTRSSRRCSPRAPARRARLRPRAAADGRARRPRRALGLRGRARLGPSRPRVAGARAVAALARRALRRRRGRARARRRRGLDDDAPPRAARLRPAERRGPRPSRRRDRRPRRPPSSTSAASTAPDGPPRCALDRAPLRRTVECGVRRRPTGPGSCYGSGADRVRSSARTHRAPEAAQIRGRVPRDPTGIDRCASSSPLPLDQGRHRPTRRRGSPSSRARLRMAMASAILRASMRSRGASPRWGS